MFGSSILEVAIGMVFVYLLMSLICSAANEIIESFLKNRATDLERGLREMFNQEGGGHLAQVFYNHPMINGLFQGKYRRAADKAIGRLDYLRPTNLPTYIPARNFSYAVLDLLLHPPAEASVPRDDAAGGVAAAVAPVNVSPLPISVDAVRTAITRNLSHTEAGRALRTLAEQSGEDINALRENMEAWFNGAMDRVSGHYKRRTKWIIFVLGFSLTAFLNVNTITVANRLSSDNTLRSVIVARAEAFANRANGQPQQQAAGGGQTNVGDAETAKTAFDANKAELEGLGLPIGWPGGFHFVWPWEAEFKGYENLWGPLIGWLLTAGAISMGAPFWFDMLNKIMVIRSTVKPHEKSPEEDSDDRQKTPDAKTRVLVTGGGLGGAPLSPTGAGGGGGSGAVPASEPVQTPEPEVAAAPQAEDNESDIDGCDIDFSVEEATTDEELPPTKGGVG